MLEPYNTATGTMDPIVKVRSQYKNCDCTDGCKAVLTEYVKKNPSRTDIKEYLQGLK